MTRRFLSLALLLSFCVVHVCAQRPKIILIDGKEAVAGSIILKLKPQAALPKTAQIAAKTILLRLYGATVRKEWMTGSELWSVHPEETERVINELKKNPQVEYAVPDYLDRITGSSGKIPNDPLFNKQWHLLNTGQDGGTPGADIRATEAWNITTGDSTIIVAVIDCGVDKEHPDLKSNIWVNKREIPGNGIDDDGNGWVDDTFGWDFIVNDNNPVPHGNSHGTACAGLIAAVQNNGVGVSGIAPSVKIMVLRNLDSTGEGPNSAGVSALEYAIKNGAKIINCSYAGMGSSAQTEMLALASQKEILVVASAGNSHDNLDDNIWIAPAKVDLPNIVAVGNSTYRDSLAASSSFGQINVDVVAPGDGTYTTSINGAYNPFGGTSASAPVASGVAALVRSAFPNLTAAQVRQQLISSSDLVPALYKLSQSDGRINAARAVQGLFFTDLQVAPKSVNFGINKVGTTGAGQSIVIRNPSGASLTVDSLVLTGSFSFSVSDTTAQVLRNLLIGARDSSVVTMYFVPSAKKIYEGVIRAYQKNSTGQLVTLQTHLMGEGVLEGSLITTRSVSGHWTKMNSPYLISVDVEVSGELVIDAGARIVFGGNRFLACTGSNKLFIRGTATDSVLLTADNTLIGWGGIILIGTLPGNVIIEYANIRNSKGTSGNIVVRGRSMPRGWGAALYGENSSPIVRHCFFSDNSASAISGSAIGLIGGGAPRIENCEFRNNTGYAGTIALNGCGEGVFNNLLLANNKGGYASAWYFTGSDVYTINNSTVVGNSGNVTISLDVGGCAIFNNSIIYANTHREASVVVGWIYGGGPAELTFHYSDVDTFSRVPWAKTYTADYGAHRVTWGQGSFSADPKFVNDSRGDYRLAAASPAIDAGTPVVSALSLDPTDLAGNERIANGRIDLGAYEFASSTVRIPQAPQLILPADTAQKVMLKPVLQWNRTAGARTYHVQVSLTTAFASPLAFEGEVELDTLVTVGPLENSKSYFWRVNAANNAGAGGWSAVRKFTTTSVTGSQYPPAILSPAWISMTSPSPVLKWRAVTDAQTYRLQISTSQEAWYRPILVYDTVVTVTELSVPLPSGFKYWWKVAAQGEAGVAWSGVASFMLVTEVPPAPSLKNPVIQATGVGPSTQLSWAGVLTDSYQLQVSKDQTFAALILEDSTLINSFLNVVLQDPGTKYYWRVRGRNVVGWGPFSLVWSFTTGIFGPPAPTLAAPADSMKNVPLTSTLSWNAVPGATGYQVQVSALITFSSFTVNDSVVTTTSRSVGPLALNTTYFWRVRAKNQGGWGGFSSVRMFSTTKTTSVGQVGDQIPTEFSLGQNYPNPFNPSTTLKFGIPTSALVSLKVYDLLGRELETLVAEELSPGYYQAVWKAKVPSGIYLYRIQAGEYTRTMKMVLLK
jgi:subtilisin family serine protease